MMVVAVPVFLGNLTDGPFPQSFPDTAPWAAPFMQQVPVGFLPPVVGTTHGSYAAAPNSIFETGPQQPAPPAVAAAPDVLQADMTPATGTSLGFVDDPPVVHFSPSSSAENQGASSGDGGGADPQTQVLLDGPTPASADQRPPPAETPQRLRTVAEERRLQELCEMGVPDGSVTEFLRLAAKRQQFVDPVFGGILLRHQEPFGRFFLPEGKERGENGPAQMISGPARIISAYLSIDPSRNTTREKRLRSAIQFAQTGQLTQGVGPDRFATVAAELTALALSGQCLDPTEAGPVAPFIPNELATTLMETVCNIGASVGNVTFIYGHLAPVTSRDAQLVVHLRDFWDRLLSSTNEGVIAAKAHGRGPFSRALLTSLQNSFENAVIIDKWCYCDHHITSG